MNLSKTLMNRAARRRSDNPNGNGSDVLMRGHFQNGISATGETWVNSENHMWGRSGGLGEHMFDCIPPTREWGEYQREASTAATNSATGRYVIPAIAR
jgi:hypothetical protein